MICAALGVLGFLLALFGVVVMAFARALARADRNEDIL